MKGDEHIVHRVADKMLSDEKHGEINERSRAALRQALQRSGSPHVQPLEDPEMRRRIRKQTLTRHALRERSKLREEDSFWTFNVRTPNLDPTPFGILEQYPDGVISRLGDTAEEVREAHEAILHDQQLQGVRISETRDEALAWLQRRQIKEFKPWLMYLMAENGDAARYAKQYEWFIPWVMHALLTEVPDKFEVKVDGITERRVRSKERGRDTRDCVPHFDAAILALVFEEVTKQLSGTHQKAYLSERFGDGSHLPGYRKLETREVSNPNWDLDFYEILAKAEKTRAERIEAYKGKIQPNTWQKITDPEFLSGISAVTPWCLAGYETAQHYLKPEEDRESVIWLFFDENKNPGIALHAVEAYKGSERYQIRQLHGADDRQDLTEPKLVLELEQFLLKNAETFTNIDTYKDQIRDARILNDIELETRSQAFDSRPIEERSQLLRVLYEMDRPIKHFGMFGESNRAREVLARRDVLKDARVIFYDKKVATNATEVTAETEIYVGEPFPDMFRKLKDPADIFSAQNFGSGVLYHKFREVKRITLPSSSYEEMREKTKDVTFHGATKELDDIDGFFSSFANSDFSENLNTIVINSSLFAIDKQWSEEEHYNEIIKAANEIGLKPCQMNYLGQIFVSRDDPKVAEILRSGYINTVVKEPMRGDDGHIIYLGPSIREDESPKISMTVGKLWGNLAFVVKE